MSEAASRRLGLGGTAGIGSLRAWSVYIAFLILILVDLAVTPGFRNIFVLRNLLFEASPIILITLGQSLAIGTRGIDLSVGSVMGLSAAIIALALPAGQPLALLAGVGAGLLVGLFNGGLIAWLEINPLISSLALLVAARGFAQALLDGERVSLPQGGLFDVLGVNAYGDIPVVAFIAAAVVALVALVVRATTFGRYVIFVGANRLAAELAGMPARRTLFLVYGISGALAGLAGAFAAARLGASDPNYIGVNFELDAIAAAVIGGTPLSGGRISIIGGVIGVLLLQVLDSSFIMNDIDFTYAQILKALFIVAALYLQRAGG
ncbi:MAG TPA: ABC transporter permease [Acetobacteraceae bacterium]|nr:ABC transporter permease [Acetobacteraceae bacterium]